MRARPAILTLVALAAAAPAAEASCVYLGPLCQTWKSNAAIFDGTVRSIERVDRDEEMIPGRIERIGHRLVTFDVHESWLGDVGPQVQLLLWGGRWEDGGWTTSADFRVEPGRRYVIFAGRNPRGELSTTGCSGNREYSQAGPELAFLRTLKGPPTGQRILGDLALLAPHVRPGQPSRVLLDATVQLTGPEASRVVRARDNKYEFGGLGPGTYMLSVSTPPGLVSHATDVSVTIEDPYSCREVPFRFRHDTAISGFVLDAAGKPIRQIPVEATAADRLNVDPVFSVSSYSDENGRFDILGLPPGEYVVAVNLRDNVTHAVHPRTPYTVGRQEPEVISLFPGTHAWLGEWRLGPPLKPVTMRLRVLGPDGGAAAGASVALRDVTSGDRADRGYRSARTDGDGWVRFEGRTGRRYLIELGLPSRSVERPRTRSFSAEEAASGITVVLTGR